jgi:hypothetical protein
VVEQDVQASRRAGGVVDEGSEVDPSVGEAGLGCVPVLVEDTVEAKASPNWRASITDDMNSPHWGPVMIMSR